MSKKNFDKTKPKKHNQSKGKSSSNIINMKEWTLEEDKILLNYIINNNYKNWKFISSKLPGHTATQCKNRWNKNLKAGLVKGPWTVQENKLLIDWVNKNGPRNWNQCCEFIHGRSGKQCREHWNNCLNPNLIKGEWTTEEDFLIMHFYQKYNGSWKEIINLFNGRTENSIKNRFFSQLRKIATSILNSGNKRSSKIKLEDLKNYLKIGIEDAKNKYLNEKPMSEEELNNFLNKIEQKIKFKKLKSDSIEENENNESCFSTNLSNLENSMNLIKNSKYKRLTNKKRKRTKEFKDLKNDINLIEEENILNNKEKIIEKDNFFNNDDIKNEKIENNEDINTSNNLINNNINSNYNNNIINNNSNNNILEINKNKNDFYIENNNIKNFDDFSSNNISRKESDLSLKSQSSEYKTEINDLNHIYNQFNEYHNNNLGENINMNYQINNSDTKLNENNSNNSNNNSQLKKNLEKKNFIQNNNNIIENNFFKLFEPKQKNSSLFDNYIYDNIKNINAGSLFFNHVDSLTDLQARLFSNKFNYFIKPNTTYFNGNQVIDDDIENPLQMIKGVNNN